MKNLVFIFLLAFIACFSKDRVKYAETRTISHSVFDTLLHRHVSEGKVDYKGFQKDSVLFNRYTRILRANHPGENWTKDEKMAYWINAYNAFTIELIFPDLFSIIFTKSSYSIFLNKDVLDSINAILVKCEDTIVEV